MKSGTANISEIRTNKFRFDCSFHLSDAQRIRKVFEKLPYRCLTVGKVASRIFNGGRYRRVYVDNPEHGYKFLSSSDILSADLENVKMVSRKYMGGIDELGLQKGWTLITRSGTIGKCAFANAKHAQKLASEDVIRLVPNNILREGVIYAFLASRYGYALLTQGTFGAVIQHIEPDFVASLPIPEFPKDFQERIDNMIQESARLREEAAEALDEALKILQAKFDINIAKYEFTTSKVNVRRIFDSLQTRLDPPALMNNGVQAMDIVCSKFEWMPLGKTKAKVRRPGIFKRIYVEEGLPYIKGSEIFNINPFMRCEHLSKNRTPFVDEMQLYEGQILVTCAGSIGQVKIITKEYEDNKAIGSQDIIRIETKDELFTKEYLFAYLQLPFVFEYMQSMKYGSVIERVEPFHIESIPVIKPSKELSQQITLVIRRYMNDMYNAFILEDGAIKLVESEIEKWSK